MKWQSLAVLAAVGGAAGASIARADVSVDSRLSVYSDSDATTVVTPYVRASADLSDHSSVSALYTADAITSASIDVVSNASKTPIHDYRNEVELSYAHDLGDLHLGGTYIYSGEHDYWSNTGALSLSDDFDEKNTTLSAGFAYGANVVGRAGDPQFMRPMNSVDLSLAWTQVVDPTLIAQLAYELIHDDGYQASPYRYVPIGDPAAPVARLPENEPALRTRNAATAAANWALSPGVTLGGDYRFYFDDWDLQAHTLDAHVAFDLSERWILRLNGRGYTQNSAFFYEPRYDVPVAYRTTDRELSRLTEESAGAKLAWALPDFGPQLRASLDVKVDLYWFQYPDFPLLPRRFAQVFELGMGGQF